ncbi:MAG: hypothetical protein DRI90_19380 [Deltaproteobacteria bacterium]|nr:MAG: hypothetical protein DRI90_19380 [Deltaproteobacteria bacterium]
MSSVSTPPRLNCNTIAIQLPQDREPQLDVAKMWLAWEGASQALIDRPAHDRPGTQLVWTWGRDARTFDLPAEGREYAVIGRHSECDVVLNADPQLSLRHLLARTIVLDDGAVALRLMSLGASLPFFLEDGIPRWSIVAVGPLMIRLGRYVIGAFPYEPHRPSGGGPYRSPPQLHVEMSSVVPRMVRRAQRTTHVSVMAPPPELSTMAHAGTPNGAGRLTLRREQRDAAVDLQHADLERGVLIGRAERCLDHGLAQVLHNGISRTHLMLLKEHDSLYAYDLCSLQGSYSGDRKVRRCRLSDRGAALQLAQHHPVNLLWHPYSSSADRLH